LVIAVIERLSSVTPAKAGVHASSVNFRKTKTATVWLFLHQTGNEPAAKQEQSYPCLHNITRKPACRQIGFNEILIFEISVGSDLLEA
jgi:hypothetical protein